MPDWAYTISPLLLALIIVAVVEVLSLCGLLIIRRYLLPHLQLHDGINDAVSGTVQAIGVFYGITVGLIAIGVWNSYTGAADVVSKEAASIGALYRDISGFPEPTRTQLRSTLRQYTHSLIEKVWPAQRDGRIIDDNTRILNDFQSVLMTSEPKTAGQTELHHEALTAYNLLINYRRLRIDGVNSGLSWIMWMVIWVGAAISIGVAYLFDIKDTKVHVLLVSLMAGFLALVIFMIGVNDRPYNGANGISPESYQLILDKLIDLPEKSS